MAKQKTEKMTPEEREEVRRKAGALLTDAAAKMGAARKLLGDSPEGDACGELAEQVHGFGVQLSTPAKDGSGDEWD